MQRKIIDSNVCGYGLINCELKNENIMTRQKELGYELGNVLWHNLEGYQELWNKAEFDTKEKIINELGELAIKLTIPDVVVPKGTLCETCNKLDEITITLCKECYLESWD